MKKLTLTLCVIALSGLCQAGPERYSGKDKEVIQPAPSCDWYRAGEWDLDLWGAYVVTDGEEDNEDFNINNFDYPAADREFDLTGQPVLLGEFTDDHFLGRDQTWGGGADLKYFWSRYFGAGVEGFILGTDNVSGAFLGTFTVRYPIGCSRFAPYAFGGFGVFAGGDVAHREFFFAESHVAPGVEAGEKEFVFSKFKENKQAKVIGQLGAGLEFRITRPSTMSKLAVGLLADFTWNFIGGDDGGGFHGSSGSGDNGDTNQDFGMARFGLNLSY